MKTILDIFKQLAKNDVDENKILYAKKWYSEEEWNTREQKVKEVIIRLVSNDNELDKIIKELGID